MSPARPPPPRAQRRPVSGRRARRGARAAATPRGGPGDRRVVVAALVIVAGVVLMLPLAQQGGQRARAAARSTPAIDPPAGGGEAPRPGADRRGDLRGDQVRPPHLADRRRGADADRAADRGVPRPPVGGDHVPRLRPRHPAGQHRLRQLLPALSARTSTTATRCWRSPPTTAGETNVDRWVARPRARAQLHDRRDPVPGDAGVREAGAAGPAASTARRTPSSSATAERRG